MSKADRPLQNDPAFLRYYARVLLREARARRGTKFAAFLIGCAARARRESIEAARPEQMDLFGAAA